ncbi:Multicopper oxidase [Macleaya cordata]|uniref:Multicopper oxidase n=1 Tax=Macleaya cordata TaxID=56857 RepID=A0A200RAB8_MACCD|nr:Multicopper oxidase [Macleaya cordata]
MEPISIRLIRFLTSPLFLYTSLLVLLICCKSVNAEAPNLYYDWTVSYAQRAPLGIEKQVIVINDQFPGPLLNATTNDMVHVTIHNNLTEPFLLTWNGVQQRRNSWQDGVRGTNCPIPPGQTWTYHFQMKDQIGSFFYFPTLLFQKAAGGYGPIRVFNRPVITVPFPPPLEEFDILIGDWYISDYHDMRASLDRGIPLPSQPNGILINGLGPYEANFTFQPGATYRLRISNVGLKTSLNFRIQDHLMQLVETEGSYTLKQYYQALDIHVGQSYSVLVTANQTSGMSYYMVASSRFMDPELNGVALIRYPGSLVYPVGPLPPGPEPFDYTYSMQQALSIRWDLAVGAARPNPQGSFHYGLINISRTIILQNDVMIMGDDSQPYTRYTINGISFVNPDTPLKLADYFQLNDIIVPSLFPDRPDDRPPALGSSVIDARYRHFIHIVFQNTQPSLQTWHIDGYNFFVVGMDGGTWDESRRLMYNMVDAVSRSTVQVYPYSWTAILMELDNQGMWNLRSQDAEKWYLGQELYMRVKGEGQEDPSTIPTRDENPLPENVIKCGRATAGPV